jgi:hypothetical protein
MAQKQKLHLLFHCHADIDLYGPLRNCSTEMQESQNKEICKSVHRTTMINPSKDIHVQMQNKGRGFVH